MNYGFFDYKHDIPDFDSDLFSPQHIIYILLVYVLGIFVSYLLRNTKKERITVVLRCLAVFSTVFEATKITWESYYDVIRGYGFNWGGILPIYTCSLFIYTLYFAGWGRGKVKDTALAFLSTIGLLYGAVGVVYCNGLNFYPFWTFGAFDSLYFHSAMFIVGVFLLMTQYKTLNWPDVWRSCIPVALLSLVAIPVNYALGSDYMMIYSGSGVPIYEDIAAYLGERGLRFLYTILMMVTHLPLSAAIVGIYKLIRLIARKLGARRKSASADPETTEKAVTAD